MKTTYRTHTCCELTAKNMEEQVHLIGWVNSYRNHGDLIFIDLRDRYGITQIVFDPAKDQKIHEEASSLRNEWVIAVTGRVIARAQGMANPNLHTGEIEIEASSLIILNGAKTPPFPIADDKIEANEELRLTHRYLDLRRRSSGLVSNLETRHKALLEVRRFLDSESFIEVETPILTKSTPEGARDYLVPSRVHPHSFYALPQSPQIYKQLTMIGGLDRYFQIARCFRDEDLRADRQPEFTQIDIEMSFVSREDIMSLTERMMNHIFESVLSVKTQLPILRLSYDECLEKYGTDKPDLRFEMPLHRVDNIARRSEFGVFKSQLDEGGSIKAICVKNGSIFSRREIDELTAFVKPFHLNGLAWVKVENDTLSSNIAKFFSPALQKEMIEKTHAEHGDLILFAAAREEVVNMAMDNLRRHLASKLELIRPDQLALLWVTDFPLFEKDPETGGLASIHHPFTGIAKEDEYLLDTDPLKIRSDAYDMVCNGYEIGGGSIRIHDKNIQQKIFNLLSIKPEEQKQKFGFLLNALEYGAPPHGGIAMGVDRICMILSKTDSIRDVIAFPKTKNAADLMMHCPSQVAISQLEELHIQLST